MEEVKEEEKQELNETTVMDFNMEEYESYYETKILGVTVDLVIDDDDEYKHINRVQNKGTGLTSPINIKNKKRLSEISAESSVSGQSQVRRGQRNRNTSDNKDLGTIKEEDLKDIQTTAKKILCDTILEERSNI